MSLMNIKDIVMKIAEYRSKPSLFEPGETLFWDDPHISRSMLEAHLDPHSDAASRKPTTIDKDVANLMSSGFLKPGDSVLDLGCGPGLYSSRLAEKGLRMTGIDISERSLDYARRQAAEKGLGIDYRRMDFFDIDFPDHFDAVIQVNGELNTFSDEKLKDLLGRIWRSLRNDGLLIFDSTTRKVRRKAGLTNRWYVSEAGFWRPGHHVVLEEGFDYPEDDVWLNQYIVIDEEKVTVYRLWFHDYSLETIRPVLKNSGFDIVQTWNDMTGTPYSKGGDNITIVAKKI